MNKNTFVNFSFLILLFSFAINLSACRGNQKENDLHSSEAQNSEQNYLFLETSQAYDTSDDDYVKRSLFVKVNLSLLIDAEGLPLDFEPADEIILNLFPNLSYVGILNRIEVNDEKSWSWIGDLKDVENGYFYLVVSDGVFLGHFASPEGIYEVHYVEDDIYEVIQIDQTVLEE